jgi:hypothetical protein
VRNTAALTRAPRWVLAEHRDRARCRPEQPEEDLDRRALPGAVLAEDAGDAVVDAEAHVVERDDAVVSLRQALGGDQR